MKLEEEIKGRFRNEYHKGFINLTVTTRRLNYQLFQALKEHHLTEPQYNVLRILRGFQHEAPLSIAFIKERMLDKNSDVSRILDKLLSKKLIERRECPTDRRQKDVVITNEGLNLLDDLLKVEKTLDTLLQPLDKNEIDELNRLLDKIRPIS